VYRKADAECCGCVAYVSEDVGIDVDKKLDLSSSVSAGPIMYVVRDSCLDERKLNRVQPVIVVRGYTT
jgi:hypothetical protein